MEVVAGTETSFHRSSNHSLWNRCPFLCHPERTRISYFTALTGATYVVLATENHMQLTEVATLDRKSGGAEGSAVHSISNQPQMETKHCQAGFFARARRSTSSSACLCCSYSESVSRP
jgi:hypothetical protein